LARQFKQHLHSMLPALLLALLGLAASLAAFSYDVGSFTRMGPGFFPLVLGITLVLLSIGIIARDFDHHVHLPAFAWRPFLAVSAGILAWVFMVETLGFFIASACQVIGCALALPGSHWRGLLILAAVLSTGGYLLFVVQLGVPLSAFG